MVPILIVAGLLVWLGATLLLDAWWARWSGPDLTDRLLPFQGGSIADEAQQWLDNRA